MLYRLMYFKDQSPDDRLISGLPLPKDEDGVVRDKQFEDCTFHPNCQDVRFVDCTFVRCTETLRRPKEAVITRHSELFDAINQLEPDLDTVDEFTQRFMSVTELAGDAPDWSEKDWDQVKTLAISLFKLLKSIE